MTELRIHPRGLLVLACFAGLLLVARDVRLGMAAAAAVTVIDWLVLAGLCPSAALAPSAPPVKGQFLYI